MKQPKELPSLARLLDAVPMQNRAVRVESHGSTFTLWVPIRRRWWMRGPLSWALPFRSEKGVALDVIGSEVWSACDGERRVEDIVAAFAQHHRLRFHEARSSVTQFLKSLVERRLLVLAVPGGAAALPPAQAARFERTRGSAS
jgi:hypothetical protein